MNYYTIDKNNTLTPATVLKIPGVKLDSQQYIFSYPEKLATKKGHGWQLIDNIPVQLKDNRGEIYNTANGEPLDWQQLGDIPSGYTLLAPEAGQIWNGKHWEYSIETKTTTLFNGKVIEINNEYNQHLEQFYSSVTGENYRYSADNEAQLNLTSLVVSGKASNYYCYDKNNEQLYITHSPEQLHTLGLEMTAYKKTLMEQQGLLLQKLNLLAENQDLKGLELVTWANN